MSIGRDALIIAWVLGAAYVAAPAKPHRAPQLSAERKAYAPDCTGHTPRTTKDTRRQPKVSPHE